MIALFTRLSCCCRRRLVNWAAPSVMVPTWHQLNLCGGRPREEALNLHLKLMFSVALVLDTHFESIWEGDVRDIGE